METEGRKRQGSDGNDEGRSRTRMKEEQTATEAEVEEFFAILRRIHTATRYFGDGKRKSPGEGGYKFMEKGVRWRPSFEWEDFFDAGNAVKSDGESLSAREDEKRVPALGDEVKKTQENVVLDLNAEPEPEPEPEPVPVL